MTATIAVHESAHPNGTAPSRYNQLRAALLNVAGLAKIQAPTPIVDGWLYRDSLAWLHGKSGRGKTFVAVDLAACVATGRPWHGHDVTRGTVLYVIAEGAAGLHQRIEAWSLAHGTPVEGIHFLPLAVQVIDQGDLVAFVRLVAEIRPVLLVLDTQARVTVGADELSQKDMGMFVENLEQIRQACGACILLVHHEPRNGENLRGSTVLEGAATTIARVDRDGQVVEITNTKQKDGPEQPAIRLAMSPVASSLILSHEAVGISGFMRESENALLTVLREAFGTRGATKTELRDAANQPKSTYYRSLQALQDRGLVRVAKEGRSTVYTLAAVDLQQEIPTSPTSPTTVPSDPVSQSQVPHTFRCGTGGTEGHDHEGSVP